MGITLFSNISNVRGLAYDLYKLDWEQQHNINTQIKMDNIQNYYDEIRHCNKSKASYTYNEYLEEFGYNGELYSSFDEFIDNEYQDEEYMRSILNDENYNLYINDYIMETSEYNILNKILEKSHMNEVFSIEQFYGFDYIRDLESNDVLCLQDGLSQILEGYDNTDNVYDMSKEDYDSLQGLLDRFGIDYQLENTKDIELD